MAYMTDENDNLVRVGVNKEKAVGTAEPFGTFSAQAAITRIQCELALGNLTPEEVRVMFSADTIATIRSKLNQALGRGLTTAQMSCS